jgi:hypothetical protein
MNVDFVDELAVAIGLKEFPSGPGHRRRFGDVDLNREGVGREQDREYGGREALNGKCAWGGKLPVLIYRAKCAGQATCW